jgi:hypothetical protein
MNTFITPNWVTKDVAMNWKNNIRLLGRVDRTYGDDWKNKPEGAQIGYTVQQRIQQRWVVTEGQQLQQQAILNQTVPISLTHQLQIGMGWSSADATVLVEEVQSRYTKPAGRSMANKCDALLGAEVYKAVYFTIGTPGSPITANETYTDGVAKLVNAGVPEDLAAVLDPKAMSKIVSANFAIFNLPGGNKNFRTGQFSGENLGISEWYTDPNMPTHTTGTFTSSTPVTTSAGQTGSTLTISGMGTYALKAGDTFKVAGVNMVNPISYVDTGELQEFTLTLDVSGSSTATLTFSPSIITSGQLQTVTGSPASGAALTFSGATGTVSATMAATASRQSLIFNPAAFAFVNADLKKKLAGAESSRVSDKEANVSMRWVEQYNIQTDQMPSRVDMLVGNAAVLPYFALRAWGG